MGKGYQLRAAYSIGQEATLQGVNIAAIDQGEVRTATVFDGENTIIYSGRLIRAKVRYRAKTIGRLDTKISRTKKGSCSRKKLVAAKHQIIRKLDNQINDILHKPLAAVALKEVTSRKAYERHPSCFRTISLRCANGCNWRYPGY